MPCNGFFLSRFKDKTPIQFEITNPEYIRRGKHRRQIPDRILFAI